MRLRRPGRSAHASSSRRPPRRVDALAAGLGLIKLGRFVQRRGGVRRRAARTLALRMLGSRHV